LLWPHVQTAPADVSAMLCSAPALTPATPVSLGCVLVPATLAASLAALGR